MRFNVWFYLPFAITPLLPTNAWASSGAGEFFLNVFGRPILRMILEIDLPFGLIIILALLVSIFIAAYMKSSILPLILRRMSQPDPSAFLQMIADGFSFIRWTLTLAGFVSVLAIGAVIRGA